MRIRVVFACAAVAVVAIFGLAAAQSVDVIDSARLTGADRDAGNWMMYGRTYDDHRFSPLTAINTTHPVTRKKKSHRPPTPAFIPLFVVCCSSSDSAWSHG